MAPHKKKKLNATQTKQLIPVFKQFNKLAEVFIRSLTRRIEQKKKKTTRINVLLNKAQIPLPEKQHNISVHTIDIGKTTAKTKGKYSFNQKMDWESDLRDKKKGIIL